jgi:hypothetical protein
MQWRQWLPITLLSRVACQHVSMHAQAGRGADVGQQQPAPAHDAPPSSASALVSSRTEGADGRRDRNLRYTPVVRNVSFWANVSPQRQQKQH